MSNDASTTQGPGFKRKYPNQENSMSEDTDDRYNANKQYYNKNQDNTEQKYEEGNSYNNNNINRRENTNSYNNNRRGGIMENRRGGIQKKYNNTIQDTESCFKAETF